MTQDQISELRRLLAEATPGPWEAVGCELYAPAYCDSDPLAVCAYGDDYRPKDAALIVGAVNALGSMCDEIEMLRARVKELENER